MLNDDIHTKFNLNDKAVLAAISEINNGIFKQLYANMEHYMNILNTYFS